MKNGNNVNIDKKEHLTILNSIIGKEPIKQVKIFNHCAVSYVTITKEGIEDLEV